jgi:hypothetical protein
VLNYQIPEPVLLGVTLGKVPAVMGHCIFINQSAEAWSDMCFCKDTLLNRYCRFITTELQP